MATLRMFVGNVFWKSHHSIGIISTRRLKLSRGQQHWTPLKTDINSDAVIVVINEVQFCIHWAHAIYISNMNVDTHRHYVTHSCPSIQLIMGKAWLNRTRINNGLLCPRVPRPTADERVRTPFKCSECSEGKLEAYHHYSVTALTRNSSLL